MMGNIEDEISNTVSTLFAAPSAGQGILKKKMSPNALLPNPLVK
jgi:hypothetical protein